MRIKSTGKEIIQLASVEIYIEDLNDRIEGYLYVGSDKYDDAHFVMSKELASSAIEGSPEGQVSVATKDLYKIIRKFNDETTTEKIFHAIKAEGCMNESKKSE